MGNLFKKIKIVTIVGARPQFIKAAAFSNSIKSYDSIDEVIIQANSQLGGFWRLPTRKELENLVCMSCDKVKINDKFFPNTPYEPFWTGEKNNWSKTKGFYWSVNFFTGHTFGRFPGHIPNFVRLVSER